MLYKTYIAISKAPGAGEGLFAAEAIPQGALLGVCAIDYDILQKSEYDAQQAKGDKAVIKGAYRLVGDLYMCSHDPARGDNYINHADDPNILYYCGMMFALKSIAAEEELTCDYRLFLSEDDATAFADAHSSEIIKGYDATKTLAEGARKILELCAAGPIITRKKS